VVCSVQIQNRLASLDDEFKLRSVEDRLYLQQQAIHKQASVITRAADDSSLLLLPIDFSFGGGVLQYPVPKWLLFLN
jgi:hypothetical protein